MKPPDYRIRKLTIHNGSLEDLEDIVQLFAETIRGVNSRDYSEIEVEVWASGSKNTDAWSEKIDAQSFYIARYDSKMVGFSSITENGYLDYMFVHKDFQRCGIASSLLQKIEEKARAQNNDEIYAYVSITARKFFEKNGYVQTGRKFTTIDDVEFVSDKMNKKLTSPNEKDQAKG